MWKLLFSERPYSPLPKSWHAWHFGLALVGPGAAWLLLANTRSKMEKLGAKKLLEQAETSKAEEVHKELKEDELQQVKEQVNELRQEILSLKTEMMSSKKD